VTGANGRDDEHVALNETSWINGCAIFLVSGFDGSSSHRQLLKSVSNLCLRGRRCGCGFWVDCVLSVCFEDDDFFFFMRGVCVCG
jgi:hypothetical protein